MSAPFTEEQEELRRYARQWLDERAPLDHVREIMESGDGYDPAQWSELGELGWLGMSIPEDYGGAGYGFTELAVLAEEMGRSLYPSPFLSSVVMGASAVALGGSESQRAELLPGVASGDLVLTVAIAEGARGWATDSFETKARPEGDGWLVDGTKEYVVGGHADAFVVAAAGDDGPVLVVVAAGEPGVSVRTLPAMDLTRPLSTVTFDAAPGRRLGDGDAGVVLDEVLRRGVAALAMEQVGGAQACLDMSVAYAKDRHQFGRPIGSFQAVKHMCADMLVQVESARSAAYHLATAIDEDRDEVEVAAPLAKSFASEAYLHCAGDTIQIHGGIGFTWEHDAHLYLKRAKSSQLLFGGPSAHRTALADRLGL